MKERETMEDHEIEGKYYMGRCIQPFPNGYCKQLQSLREIIGNVMEE